MIGWKKKFVLSAVAAATALLFINGPVTAQGARLANAAQHKDMNLVGFNNLQARSAYQPVIQQQGNRWIAYIGHHGGQAFNQQTQTIEQNGTSIVDVTDPV